jgi:hypothetical protein
MDFFFRIPGWLLSLLISLGFLPITTFLVLDVTHRYPSIKPPLLTYLDNNGDNMLLLFYGSTVILVLWLSSIIIHYCQNESKNWLLAIPAVFCLLFLGLMFPLVLAEIFRNSLILDSIITPLKRIIEGLGAVEFFLSGLGVILLTGLAGTYAATRLTYKSKKDWLLTPLQVLTFPIGVIFLQPRLRKLIERKEMDAPEDHFLDQA